MVEMELLKEVGFRCTLASDAKQAVEAVTDSPFDLVLMDCQMPEMDGFEATRMIRQQEAKAFLHGRGKRLPIVALTANALKGDRERCLAAGMDDYLSKPLRPNELDAVLERWLGAAPAGAAPAASPAEPGDALVDEERMRVFRDDYPEIVEQLVDLFVDST